MMQVFEFPWFRLFDAGFWVWALDLFCALGAVFLGLCLRLGGCLGFLCFGVFGVVG